MPDYSVRVAANITAMRGRYHAILVAFAGALAWGAPVSAQPADAPARSPRNANYAIAAQLDARSHRLTGTERIVWRNVTSRATSELQFHLYWNAWKDARSTFMREQAVAGSPPAIAPRDAGSIDVTSVRVTTDAGTTDITSTRAFLAPDDGNSDDRTVMQVSLPAPVVPGGSLTIDVAWTSVVPRPIARTGVIGDFYFVAQWFPKLGVLQDGGWNCHQFHATTEFFSDYGVYDVTLTVPSGWTVGATGRQQDRRDAGRGNTVHRYYQEDVHDFAWTTSPEFIERTARFDEPGLPPVDMRLLLMPEHLGQEERHFAAAKSALRRFGQWFGPYPYGHLTIVDPAFRSEAEGMEYPTLITAGTRWLVPRVVTINTPEEVTLHEAGHQFWYGIVGTNEFEAAWMDEGINTWATARAMAEDFPQAYHEERFFGGFVPWSFHELPLRRETFWNRLAGYRRAVRSDPLTTPSYLLSPALGRFITYNKTALWLNSVERAIGWPTMQRIFSAFFTRFQFGHPAPADFFATAAAVAGRDLSPYLDDPYKTSNVFDYGIERLRSDREDGQFRTSVTVRRYGEGVFPVSVVVTFENGDQITEPWDGRDRWRDFSDTRGSRAVTAVVDADETLLLDINRTNNSRTLQPEADAAATKWSLKWMVWLQDHLLSWAFFL